MMGKKHLHYAGYLASKHLHTSIFALIPRLKAHVQLHIRLDCSYGYDGK